VDFWELIVLRIYKRGTTPKMKPMIRELIRIYQKYLHPAISPYEETLQGRNAEEERESFRKRIKEGLREFNKELEFHRDIARSNSFIATLDEIRDDLREKITPWDEQRKDAFEKLFLDCMRGST